MYTVSGKVVESSEALILLQHRDEKWEIARGPGETIKGSIRTGDEISVNYQLIAAVVNVLTAQALQSEGSTTHVATQRQEYVTANWSKLTTGLTFDEIDRLIGPVMLLSSADGVTSPEG